MNAIAKLKDAPPINAFRFVPVGDAARDIKPTDWLVRGFLEADTLAMLFGDPASGKSFAAIDLALCVATGALWHGHKAQQGTVFYIAGEGHGGVSKRFRAWSIARQVSLEDTPAFLSQKGIGLKDEENAAAVARAVDDLAKEHGKPSLIVVDTVARNFGAGDENSTQDMGQFIANIDEWLHHRYGACVLLVHHTGHGDKQRARGASALKAALDAEYRVSKDEDGVIRIEGTKMKDAPIPEPQAFKLRPVDLPVTDDAGNPETSAVLDPTEYEPKRRTSAGRLGANQQACLDVLRRLYAEDRRKLEAAGQDPDCARVERHRWEDACKRENVDRRRVHDVPTALQKKGFIRLDRGFVYLVD